MSEEGALMQGTRTRRQRGGCKDEERVEERYLDFLREEMRGVLDLRSGAHDLEIDRGRQEKKRNRERRGSAKYAAIHCGR